MFKSKLNVLAAVTAAVCVSCTSREYFVQETPLEMSFSLCSGGVDFGVVTKTTAANSTDIVAGTASDVTGSTSNINILI